MAVNAYNRYQEQSVMTMTRGEMLTKLYDEAIKQLNNGVHFIKEKDTKSADQALKKAQMVIDYLRSTLNMQYPISNNLTSLYRFFSEQIVSANIHRVTKPLEDIIPLIQDLRDAFVQADKQVRMEKQHSAGMVG